MAKLTAKELEALTEQDVGIIIRDEGSLAGRVSLRKKGIAIPFYFQFRWEGIYTRFSCGTWPNKSLTEIRKERNRRHDDTLVLASGANGEWTPHDLRRTGATMMQAWGISLDVIDRCQNHVLAGSRVRRHYLHHDYAEEKKEAWNLLGEKLTDIMIGQDGLERLGRGNSNGHKAPMTTASTTGKLNPN